jgi:F-box interacting protein
MNLPPSQSRSFLPKELIVKVLSLLPVKSMMRMRCLGKSYNSLFIDPIFVKMHLQQSARNPHLALVTTKKRSAQNPHLALITTNIERVIPFPVRNLLDNPSISLDEDPHYLIVGDIDNEGSNVHRIVGSCNGLICLLIFTYSRGYRDAWLQFWNPSTRTRSEKLGYLRLFSSKYSGPIYYEFTFGYDNLTSTFKVVMLSYHSKNMMILETKVFGLGENIWRNITNLPVVPLQVFNVRQHYVVYLSGTLNWLAVFDFPIDSVNKYVIISLDLGTETYTQMRLPQGFDKLSQVDPTISVLNGRLSFSYDVKQTHFVLWHMMDFRVVESWTPLLQISYENLQIDYFGGPIFYLVPLHLSEDCQTLILASTVEDQAILYNTRNNSVERTRIPNTLMDYVESLVSIC